MDKCISDLQQQERSLQKLQRNLEESHEAISRKQVTCCCLSLFPSAFLRKVPKHTSTCSHELIGLFMKVSFCRFKDFATCVSHGEVYLTKVSHFLLELIDHACCPPE